MTDNGFEDLRKNYNLAEIIERHTGQQARHGNMFRCLFHEDSTPSMKVYDNGTFYCFGCGKWGDVGDILAYFLGCEPWEVRDRIGDLAPTLPKYTIRSAPKLEYKFSEADVAKFEDGLKDRQLETWRLAGITASTVYQLRIGYTGDRWVFPWLYRGDPIGFKLRRDDTVAPHLEPKYTSVPGSHFFVPYNIDVLATNPERVLIVEDERSVIAAHTHKLAAVAMPASQFKPEWWKLFVAVPEIIIVADNDPAGLASAEKTRLILKRGTVVTVPVGKDLADYHAFLKEKCGELSVVDVAIYDWLND